MPKSIKAVLTAVLSLLLIVALIIALVYSQKLYLKKAYPLKYTEYVEKYSNEYGLDPFFVYSVIRTESDFVPNATSSIGARGLMQVTEETFEWIRGRLKDNESTFDSMYDEETAIRYGTYLMYFLKQTLQTEQNILCGYHAGVNRAKSWLDDGEISKNGEIITENIPFPDTKQYVKKVMKTFEIYKKLYS